jgi:hypothetical protein
MITITSKQLIVTIKNELYYSYTKTIKLFTFIPLYTYNFLSSDPSLISAHLGGVESTEESKPQHVGFMSMNNLTSINTNEENYL